MYTLLTGATGMLGRYLMRDMLLRGRNVAVLVRARKRVSAIERVDAALGYWERMWQRTLPRPVVLTGDITQEGFGLSHPDRRWLGANCQAVLHSAASLKFYEEDGEPWRSNVDGVRHVLDVCEDLKIRRLYQVSTAYTCGLRSGTVYENELDIGQKFGNDYERSKVQAEELVRQATCLDVAAILRPSIIIGDSLTGFSSTFHGFYTPLRLICAMRAQLSHEQVFANDFMAAMGLSGDEGKNFVPVDWVSQAIVSIILRVPDVSQTYGLTTTSPVTSGRLIDVIRAVTKELGSRNTETAPKAQVSLETPPSDPMQAAYTEQLHTYRSYWRDDPVFDCSNTTAVLPDLPCPVVTDDMLIRLSKCAIATKFAPPLETNCSDVPTKWFQADRSRAKLSAGGEAGAARVLTITGQGGGSWSFATNEPDPLPIHEGRIVGAPELCISSKAFARIVAGETTLNAAARAGDLVAIGRACPLDSWRDIFHAAQAETTAALDA